MKKIYALSTLLTFICSTVYGEVSKPKKNYFVEAKAAYFSPTDDQFNDVYSGGAMYGVEFDARAWKELYAWIDVNYFSKAGYTSQDRDHTRLTMVPITVGVKYLMSKEEFWKPYIGFGADATYLHVNTDSQDLQQNASHWGFGWVAKIGMVITPNSLYFIDLFASYSDVTVHMHHSHSHYTVIQDVNLNGFAFGGGIGCRF